MKKKDVMGICLLFVGALLFINAIVPISFGVIAFNIGPRVVSLPSLSNAQLASVIGGGICIALGWFVWNKT